VDGGGHAQTEVQPQSAACVHSIVCLHSIQCGPLDFNNKLKFVVEHKLRGCRYSSLNALMSDTLHPLPPHIKAAVEDVVTRRLRAS